MAKLTSIISFMYIIVAGALLTSCFATRPLLSRVPSEENYALAGMASSNSRKTGDVRNAVSTPSQTASTTTESDEKSVEHEETMSDADWEALVDESGPCVEDTELSSTLPAEGYESETGRGCHRMLGDYPPPERAHNTKHR